MGSPAALIAAVVATFAVGCRTRTSVEPGSDTDMASSRTAASDAMSGDTASVDALPTANPRPDGISHADMMRLYLGDAGSDAGAADETPTPGGALAPDTAFTGSRAVHITRARYAITLPDEIVSITTERALRIDDQGDRASIGLVGTGLPVAPGTRVMARSGLLGFVLVSPDGAHYRATMPDELQHWFTGASSRPPNSVNFRRAADTIVATRGGLSLVIATERQGDLHPLVCRGLVAMFLGGDPAASRVGCAGARMPVRATLRARGWPAVVLERAESTSLDVIPPMVAVPPADAANDLTIPTRNSDGAFFAPTELSTLPGDHSQDLRLTVTNGFTREAMVFADDLAIGWLAAGATGSFVGLASGRHAVRARSFDGLERSRSTNVTLPATLRVENLPLLAQ